MTANVIKVVLSFLFFICLAKMPYGYYQFVRFLTMIGFVLLAIDAKKNEAKIETVIFIALALLFQPFMKIALGRSIWNIIDVTVGISLVFSIFFKVSTRKNGKTN